MSSEACFSALEYAHRRHANFIRELEQFIEIPSVSTDPAHKGDMNCAADFLTDQLSRLGADHIQLFPTAGHPILYGDLMRAGDDAPTMLIYGHYDVQPPDPLDQWDTPPFEPHQQGDYLYGRGASDMKGQVMASLKALEAAQQNGGIPVNIRFLFEGEEEIGSPNLDQFLEAHKDLLKGHFVLNPDAGMISEDNPTIVYGLRGLAYFELRVFGPAHDLHSGLFGGVVHNPAQVLCDLIAGMHDQEGRVTLPGYYDSVLPLSSEERAADTYLPMNERYYLDMTGAPALWGETGYLPAERVGSRPTLEVNGMLSGFIGQGSKTVIPAWAMAKLSMRLVPAQEPAAVHQQLTQYLEEHAPCSVRWELTQMAGGPASITPRDTPAVRALSQAMQTVWGKPPIFKREGGSVPVVASMKSILQIDSVLTGFGLPDDRVHAPNERLHLPTWERGIDTLIHFLYNL